MRVKQFGNRMKKAQGITPTPEMLWDKSPAILDGVRNLELYLR